MGSVGVVCGFGNDLAGNICVFVLSVCVNIQIVTTLWQAMPIYRQNMNDVENLNEWK